MLTVKPIRATAIAALLLSAAPAGAEVPLTDFNGQWIGQGTDRDTPVESVQPTRCRLSVAADPTTMTTDTACNGRGGLRKRLRLVLSFSGNSFTGTAEQTSSRRGSTTAPTQRSGTVSGNRNGDTAEFTVRLPGLTPNAHVLLRLSSPTAFSMQISTLGATLTDVNFVRPAPR